MEWVETTGKTIEEAKEAALDQLGVDEQDAEFEIVEEPKSGLFGRVRREARVRARVQPKRPRPKAERRERRRKKPAAGADGNGERRNGQPSAAKGAGGAGGTNRSDKPKAAKTAKTAKASPAKTSTAKAAAAEASSPAKAASTAPAEATEADDASPEPSRDADERLADNHPRSPAQGEQMSTETVSIDEQASIIEDFLEGLVDAFGVEAEIQREEIDEEMLEVQVDAPDLGLLIGPKGQTLGAIQELSRTVLQRKATGVYEGRVRIDIAGYRNRRRAALERFATSVAEEVQSSGLQKVLEPMNPADRKVVHDTINDLDGVATSSEGTEPYRRVVIKPAE